MITLVPEYYTGFKCIAGGCRHSCCIGWEIDIDSQTYKMYSNLSGELGDKLRQHIECSGANARFMLGADERCPFLEKNGLCEIINKMGEDALCDICTDHPRFRNFFASHTEMGIGMCCEEAARLILSQTEPFSLRPLESDSSDIVYTDEESDFFVTRDKLLNIVTDRTLSFNERTEKIKKEFSVSVPDFEFRKWCDIYLSLERLDCQWTALLHSAAQNPCFDSEFFSDEKWQYISEQLLAYFIYRHLPASVSDGMLSQRIGFCLLSCHIIMMLFAHSSDRSFENFADICRMYSSEIEYSDENIDELIFVICSEA